jgi:hypothetical protein
VPQPFFVPQFPTHRRPVIPFREPQWQLFEQDWSCRVLWLPGLPVRPLRVIHLAPEQERRLRAVLDRGAYKFVEEVVEAALTAVEQRTVPGFAGTAEELDTLLAEGLASKQLTEEEFWSSVGKQTDALLAEHKTGRRS